VQTGVFEVEYGGEAAPGHANMNALLKFGLTRNLELRLAGNPLEHDSGRSAFGDSGVGVKYRCISGRGALPSIAVLYTATLPTAGRDLGTRALGHALGVLISKDYGKHHVDFNEISEWRGRADVAGFDHDWFTALAYSHPLTGSLGVTAEIAGFSRIDDSIPASMTILDALTYNVSTRLVLDCGFYVAARGEVPRATFVLGVTYSVGDLYTRLHRKVH
jgi:hypothetical protein